MKIHVATAKDELKRRPKIMSEHHTELPVYDPPKAFSEKAAIPSMQAYEALCAHAQRDYQGFWAEQAKRLITWKNPSPRSWTKVKNHFLNGSQTAS